MGQDSVLDRQGADHVSFCGRRNPKGRPGIWHAVRHAGMPGHSRPGLRCGEQLTAFWLETMGQELGDRTDTAGGACSLGTPAADASLLGGLWPEFRSMSVAV